jgi:hypothetical protein
VKNAVMLVLVAALVAGVIGNVAQRQIYGPTASERAIQAQVDAAIKAHDQAAYDRATKEQAVDISTREFVWTILPPLLIGVVGGFILYRRWPSATTAG